MTNTKERADFERWLRTKNSQQITDFMVSKFDGQRYGLSQVQLAWEAWQAAAALAFQRELQR